MKTIGLLCIFVVSFFAFECAGFVRTQELNSFSGGLDIPDCDTTGTHQVPCQGNASCKSDIGKCKGQVKGIPQTALCEPGQGPIACKDLAFNCTRANGDTISDIVCKIITP